MSDQREQQILETLEQTRRRPPTFTAPWLDMSHGAGGKASHKLIEGLLLPALNNPALAPRAPPLAVAPFSPRPVPPFTPVPMKMQEVMREIDGR